MKENLTIEELCKKYGIPYTDSTKEYIGQTSIIPIGSKKSDQPPAPPEKESKKIDIEGLEP